MMRFILKIRLILVVVLFLSSSLLLAGIDKSELENRMLSTWKIGDKTLLENWSRYEIQLYNNYIDGNISSMPRLEWNDQEQSLTVSYFNKYSKNYIGKITVYLARTLSKQSNYLNDFISSDKKYQELSINGVKFIFNETRDVEVYLGDLDNYNEKDILEKIEDRLRLAVVSNGVLNPWIRTNTPGFKSSFGDNPEYGFYLSEPQDSMRRYLHDVFESVKSKHQNSENNEEKNTELKEDNSSENEEDVSFDKGVLIQLPAGMGKTRTVFSFLDDIKKKEAGKYRVLWLVSGTDLLDKTTEAFNQHFGKDSMFSLHGNSNTEENKRNLSSYHNLSVSLDLIKETNRNSKKRGSNLDTIKQWLGLSSDPVIVVIDEAHRSAASTYLKSLEELMADRYCNKKIEFVIGLTATPYREDMELSDIYSYSNFWGIGQEERSVKTGFDQIKEAVSKGYMPIPIITALNKKSLDSDSKKNSYDKDKLENDFLKVIKNIVETNNKIIIYHSRGTNEDGESSARSKQAFEFLEENIESINTSNTLNKRFEVFIASSDVVDSKLQIQEFAKARYGILNLTNMGSFGTDIPDVDAILFLDESESRVKTLQRMGRAFRLFGGKTVTNIICWGSSENIFENLDKTIFYNPDPETIKQHLGRIRTGLALMAKLEKITVSSRFVMDTVPVNMLTLLKEVSPDMDMSYIVELLKDSDLEEKSSDKKIIINLKNKISSIEKNLNENSNIEMTREEIKTLIDVINGEFVGTVLSKIIDTVFYFNITEETSLNMVKEIIFEYTFSWMKKHRKYPSIKNFDFKYGQFSISKTRIEKMFGSLDEFKYEFIKKRIYKTEEEYQAENEIEKKELERLALMVLQSTLGSNWYEPGSEKNDLIQEMLIKFVVIPNIREDHEFKINSKTLGISSGKMFRSATKDGMFRNISDLVRKTIKYIETNIEESERTQYLDAVYKRVGLESSKLDGDILIKYREYILKKISDDNESDDASNLSKSEKISKKIRDNKFLLSEEYLFSKIYEGEEGKKLREALQDFLILIIFSFADTMDRWPKTEDFEWNVVNLSNSKIFGKTGIFEYLSDMVKKAFEYIETDIEDSQKTKYLEMILKSNVLSDLKGKIHDDVIRICREKILKKISDNEFLLSDEYLFSRKLYEGEEGAKFRKEIQDFLIVKMLSFMDKKGRWPTDYEFDNRKIANLNLSYPKIVGKVGIFSTPFDMVKKVFEYVNTNIKDPIQKTKYLDAICRSSALSTAKEVDDDLLRMCRKNILDRINDENSSLSDEYFFPMLYGGQEGKELREALQDFLIPKILSFAGKNGQWPTIYYFVHGKIINLSYSTIIGVTGIFYSLSDVVKKAIEYIDANIEEPQKTRYLHIIFKSDGFYTFVKGFNDDMLEIYRDLVRNTIKGSKTPVFHDYFFSYLYQGENGAKFKEEVQNFLISKILSFIDSNQKWPEKIYFDEDGELVKDGYFEAIGERYTFESSLDLLDKTVEYINKNYPETSDEETLQKRRLYLTAISMVCSPEEIELMKNKEVLVKMILSSEELKVRYSALYGENTSERIEKLITISDSSKEIEQESVSLTKCVDLLSQEIIIYGSGTDDTTSVIDSNG